MILCKIHPFCNPPHPPRLRDYQDSKNLLAGSNARWRKRSHAQEQRGVTRNIHVRIPAFISSAARTRRLETAKRAITISRVSPARRAISGQISSSSSSSSMRILGSLVKFVLNAPSDRSRSTARRGTDEELAQKLPFVGNSRNDTINATGVL